MVVSSEQLAAIETRSKAAITLMFDPTTSPTPSERETALAENYRRDVAALTESLRATDKALRQAADLLRRASHAPSGGERGSGRTTRMLLRSLIALSEGSRVAIVSVTMTHARDLADRLVGMAHRMGIPHEGLVSWGTSSSDMTGFRGVTSVDHSVTDGLDGDVQVRT